MAVMRPGEKRGKRVMLAEGKFVFHCFELRLHTPNLGCTIHTFKYSQPRSQDFSLFLNWICRKIKKKETSW